MQSSVAMTRAGHQDPCREPHPHIHDGKAVRNPSWMTCRPAKADFLDTKRLNSPSVEYVSRIHVHQVPLSMPDIDTFAISQVMNARSHGSGVFLQKKPSKYACLAAHLMPSRSTIPFTSRSLPLKRRRLDAIDAWREGFIFAFGLDSIPVVRDRRANE